MNRELLELMPDEDRREAALERLLVRTVTGRGVRNGSRQMPDSRSKMMERPRETLTANERRVVAALAAGLSRQETADVLGLGVETVKTTIRNAKRTLRAKSTAQLTANAVRSGVIE